VRKFRSVNDLIWYLQNHGGGEISINIGNDTGDKSVSIYATLNSGGSYQGFGAYAKDAAEALEFYPGE
jgi:hypothetical protein